MSIVNAPYVGYPDWQRESFDGPPFVTESDLAPFPDSPYSWGPFYVGGWWGVTCNYWSDSGGDAYNQLVLTWYTTEDMSIAIGWQNLCYDVVYGSSWANVTIPNQGPWLLVTITNED